MWDRKLLKKNARDAFLRNYWSCVAVCVIILLLSGTLFSYRYNDTGSEQYTTEAYVEYDAEVLMQELDQTLATINAFLVEYWFVILVASFVALVIAYGIVIVFHNVLEVGLNRYFLENREHKTSIGQLFYSFKGGRYSSTVWVMFLKVLYTLGWSLLFIVPGIIKAYSYMMVPYILAENTNLDSKRIFQLSREMMRGHKWEAFKLEWSFFGWILLASCTPMGLLNIFYVNPYVYATYTEFYCAVKADARRNGILQPDELPARLIVEEETNA